MLYRSTMPMAYGRFHALPEWATIGVTTEACPGTFDASGKCVPNMSVGPSGGTTKIWEDAAKRITDEKSHTDALMLKATSPETLTYVAVGLVAIGAAIIALKSSKRLRGMAGFGRLDCGQELWPPLKKKKKRKAKRR